METGIENVASVASPPIRFGRTRPTNRITAQRTRRMPKCPVPASLSRGTARKCSRRTAAARHRQTSKTRKEPSRRTAKAAPARRWNNGWCMTRHAGGARSPAHAAGCGVSSITTRSVSKGARAGGHLIGRSAGLLSHFSICLAFLSDGTAGSYRSPRLNRPVVTGPTTHRRPDLIVHTP